MADTSLEFTGQVRDIDPQRWNGYGYSLNNPLVNTDPTGMMTCPRCSQGGMSTAPDALESWELWWDPALGG